MSTEVDDLRCQLEHWKIDDGDVLSAVGRAQHNAVLDRAIASMEELEAALKASITAASERERELVERKDNAYEERNKVVAALARLFPSGIARTNISGWSDDWHGCVFIDLPTGQASWHYHDSQAWLFADLPPYKGEWDGHSTEEKYERLAALTKQKEGE